MHRTPIRVNEYIVNSSNLVTLRTSLALRLFLRGTFEESNLPHNQWLGVSQNLFPDPTED